MSRLPLQHHVGIDAYEQLYALLGATPELVLHADDVVTSGTTLVNWPGKTAFSGTPINAPQVSTGWGVSGLVVDLIADVGTPANSDVVSVDGFGSAIGDILTPWTLFIAANTGGGGDLFSIANTGFSTGYHRSNVAAGTIAFQSSGGTNTNAPSSAYTVSSGRMIVGYSFSGATLSIAARNASGSATLLSNEPHTIVGDPPGSPDLNAFTLGALRRNNFLVPLDAGVRAVIGITSYAYTTAQLHTIINHMESSLGCQVT